MRDRYMQMEHSIYILDSKLLVPVLSTLLIKFILGFGPLGQSNMYSTYDFCPRPARKETSVPRHKRN